MSQIPLSRLVAALRALRRGSSDARGRPVLRSLRFRDPDAKYLYDEYRAGYTDDYGSAGNALVESELARLMFGPWDPTVDLGGSAPPTDPMALLRLLASMDMEGGG